MMRKHPGWSDWKQSEPLSEALLDRIRATYKGAWQPIMPSPGILASRARAMDNEREIIVMAD